MIGRGKAVVLTRWVKNTVLRVGLSVQTAPLKKEGEKTFLVNGEIRRYSCVLRWEGNPNIHRMVILPEPDEKILMGKGRVEWGSENSW